jgi:hypothetical protein
VGAGAGAVRRGEHRRHATRYPPLHRCRPAPGRQDPDRREGQWQRHPSPAPEGRDRHRGQGARAPRRLRLSARRTAADLDRRRHRHHPLPELDPLPACRSRRHRRPVVLGREPRPGGLPARGDLRCGTLRLADPAPGSDRHRSPPHRRANPGREHRGGGRLRPALRAARHDRGLARDLRSMGLVGPIVQETFSSR